MNSTKDELIHLQRANLRAWEAHLSDCWRCQSFMGRCEVGKQLLKILHAIEEILNKITTTSSGTLSDNDTKTP